MKSQSGVRQSQMFTKTRKEAPADETSKNAQLLIRAGFAHKEMAGVYAYLPLGLRVLENIKNIIREEMNAVGGQELMMTTLQPKEIWEKTDRWDDTKVDNWFKTTLKNGTELGVGLTHEEPIVDAIGEYINSYKDLPIMVYQIQNKFRNELRAKSGLLRGREFVMKDMYSFARTQDEHDTLYERVAETYHTIYARLGLGDITYRTYADGGIFTKRFSDEFQTLSDMGEDTVYVNEEKKIAFNQEVYTDENVTKMGFTKNDFTERRGVEVGNIFPLETKYTDALDVQFKDNTGTEQSIIMGCYGIGVSRLVGVIAEHFADDRGLVWPESVAPFRIHLLRLGTSDDVTVSADNLYQTLSEQGIEVLYDDRDATNGEKFADADLIGIPYRVVISDKSIAAGGYEIKKRSESESRIIAPDDIISVLLNS